MAIRRSRRAVVAMSSCTIGFVIAIVLMVIGQSKVDSADQFNQAQRSREAQLPSVVTTPTPAPRSTQPTASSVAPVTITATPPAIQEVAPAAPESLRVVSASGDLDFTVKVDSMEYNAGLQAPSCKTSPDPECPEKAYWVRDTMGTAPASMTDNSTYIVGHSWTPSPRVFDQLSNYAMTHYETEPDPDGPPDTVRPKTTLLASVWDHTGQTQTIAVWMVPSLIDARVTLKTANGTLAYRVTTAFVAKKTDVGNVWQFQRGDPNTTTLQTCGIDLTNKIDTEYGIVAISVLESATVSS